MKTLNKILIVAQIVSIIFVFYCLIFVSKISDLYIYFFIPLIILFIRLLINRKQEKPETQKYTYQILLIKFVNILTIFIAAVVLISKLLVFIMFASLDGS